MCNVLMSGSDDDADIGLCVPLPPLILGGTGGGGGGRSFAAVRLDAPFGGGGGGRLYLWIGSSKLTSMRQHKMDVSQKLREAKIGCVHGTHFSSSKGDDSGSAATPAGV